MRICSRSYKPVRPQAEKYEQEYSVQGWHLRQAHPTGREMGWMSAMAQLHREFPLIAGRVVIHDRPSAGSL